MHLYRHTYVCAYVYHNKCRKNPWDDRYAELKIQECLVLSQNNDDMTKCTSINTGEQ